MSTSSEKKDIVDLNTSNGAVLIFDPLIEDYRYGTFDELTKEQKKDLLLRRRGEQKDKETVTSLKLFDNRLHWSDDYLFVDSSLKTKQKIEGHVITDGSIEICSGQLTKANNIQTRTLVVGKGVNPIRFISNKQGNTVANVSDIHTDKINGQKYDTSRAPQKGDIWTYDGKEWVPSNLKTEILKLFDDRLVKQLVNARENKQ